MKVGDLVRWKKHWGLIISQGKAEPIPCGYVETPYITAPSAGCDVNPWTFEGECCTWRVLDYYSECVETWCYKEQFCGWQLQKYTCYPR